MSAVPTPTDAEHEATVENYADLIGRLATHLGEKHPEWTVAGTVLAAQQIVGSHLGRTITEAAGRVRVARGLPFEANPGPAPEPEEDVEEFETHGERGRTEGLRVLQAHDGEADPDLETLEYLLVDLMHWCEDAGHFDEALESARSQFEAECEEDDAAALAAIDEEVASLTPAQEERRQAFLAEQAEQTRKQQQLARLHQHKPARFDA